MTREMEARDADGNLVAWASAGIVRSRLAGGDDWSGSGRVHEGDEFLKRVATWAATWAHAPMMARRLRVPEVPPSQIAELWEAAPALCRAMHVPRPEETASPPVGGASGGVMAALGGWLRGRQRVEEEP